MTRQSLIPHSDMERLSAYLDGALSANKAARLEARLRDDPILQRTLEELRETVRLVGLLPEVTVPRNFTLTPEMAGIKERPRAYPIMRLATALATLVFLVVVGVDTLSGSVMKTALAPMAHEQAVMEAPPPEENAMKAGEAPAEDLAVEEAESFYAEPGAEVAEEAPAFTGEAEGAFDRSVATPWSGLPEHTVAPADEDVLTEALAPTSTLTTVDDELAAVAEEEAAGGAIDELTLTPSSLPMPLLSATTTPSPISAEAQPVGAWSALRIAEVGLGVLAASLALITLWIYRKR